MEHLFIIGVDVDNGTPSVEIDEIIRKRGLFCIRYTTHSHGKDYTEVQKEHFVKYQRTHEGAEIAEYLVAEKRYLPEIAAQATITKSAMTPNGVTLTVSHPAMDKNRLVFILAKPWSVHDYETSGEALSAWKDAYMSFAAWLGIVVDKSCTDPSRLFYLPRREQDALSEAVVHQGDAIDIFQLPKGVPSHKSSGNVFIDAAAAMGVGSDKKGHELRYWAKIASDKFQIVDALEHHADHVMRREMDHDSIHHIECPFENEHTTYGGTGTFVVNAGEGTGTGFTVKCMHASCTDRDRLDFVAEMVKLEWLPRDALDDKTFLLELEDDEDAEDEGEAESEAEAEAAYEEAEAEPAEMPILDEVTDLKAADDYLRRLAETGSSLVEVITDIDNLVAHMNFKFKASMSKPEILRIFNRYATEFKRSRREAEKAAEKRRADAERDVRRKKKEREKEKESARKLERREQTLNEEVASGIETQRPIIRVDVEDHLVSVARALEALKAKNVKKPMIFRSAGSITRIVHDEQRMPRSQRMGVEELRWELSHVTRCLESEGEGFKEVPPTNNIVKHLHADPNLPFPVLGGIVTAPVFGADGKINTTPGYSASSQLYYEPPTGFEVPEVSAKPTEEEVDRAIELLMRNALVDFPFDGPDNGNAEKAHALCMVLQPFARQLINGATPIHLIVKPTPGTGASKLVNIYSLISTGEDAVAQTETRNEDEIRKRITSVLIESSPTFYLDNINYRIDSSALASAVTTSMWTDRLLGASETVRVPVKHTWIFAGNNPTMSNEIARRCIRIQLDAKVERPELRTNFKHKDLEGWVRANRSLLIWACLTLIQNWVAKGRPEGSGIKGSFESWSRVMGGILESAGLPGFLGNDGELRAASDEEGNAIKSMLSVWWHSFQQQPVPTGGNDGGLFDVIQDEDVALPITGVNVSQQKISFGAYINKLSGRLFTIDDEDGVPIQVAISPAGKKNNKNLWRLVKTVA